LPNTAPPNQTLGEACGAALVRLSSWTLGYMQH